MLKAQFLASLSRSLWQKEPSVSANLTEALVRNSPSMGHFCEKPELAKVCGIPGQPEQAG